MIGSRAMTIVARGDRELVLERGFSAPRRLVFEACTRPDLVEVWFRSPRRWSLVKCDIDLRVGGHYRYVLRRADGSETGMTGTYHEILAPERLICTERFDDLPALGETTIASNLAERSGNTLLTVALRYASRAPRDAVLDAAQAGEIAEGYDRLAHLIAEIQAWGVHRVAAAG